MISAGESWLGRERLLLIGGDEVFRQGVRGRYPDWDVAAVPSALAGIHDLCRQHCRGVLLYVDDRAARVEQIVEGLREAAGVELPVILCCPPEAEPLARKGVQAGASDYLVCPVEGTELDAALAYGRPANRRTITAEDANDLLPAAALDDLGEVLDALSAEGRVFLERLARMIQSALDGAPVRLVIEGTVVEVGEVGEEPVLVEPILLEGELLGQVSLGPIPTRPYRRADSDRLRHYARLCGRLLRAARDQRHWHELAYTDELSDLPNRRYLLQRLDEILSRAEAEHFGVSVLLFDIDDFKRYNDTCGHAAGDEIIRVAGRLFRQHCREHDLVARYGGDEFAVVFWDAEQPRVAGSQHPQDAVDVLRRFTEALSRHRFESLTDAGPCRLTISGGLAGFPWDGRTADALLRRADQALLEAKRAGKNRIFWVGRGKDAGSTDA